MGPIWWSVYFSRMIPAAWWHAYPSDKHSPLCLVDVWSSINCLWTSFLPYQECHSVSDHLCYHILPAKLWQWIFGGPFWLNVCPIGIMGQKSSLPCSCLPGVYHGNLLKLAPKPKHKKNSQALYAWPAFCIIYYILYMACGLNHHLVCYYFLTHLHSMFSFSEKGFFKHTVYATTFVTNMAAKRWKIAANPHYQTPAFCLLQVSPSSNSVKFSVLLQCLDIFTQLAADRILNKKKQIPMKLPIFPNRAANGWTLGCCFLLLDVL